MELKSFELDAKTFEKIRRVVYDKSGIALGPNKQALVSARLGKRMRALDCGDFEDYLDRVMNDAAGEEIIHLLDAISTNVTSFFRESVHFDWVAQECGNWLRAGQRRLRLWSAACSSGEEPYTLAMTLLGLDGIAGADAKIMATDISTRVLAWAREGMFASSRLDPIPPALRQRFFRSCGNDLHQASDELRRMISFRRMNLIEVPYPMRGPIDIIFCRNVMIYFDNEIRARLLREFARLLKPGGFLMVGHAESLAGQNHDGFRPVRPSIYQRH